MDALHPSKVKVEFDHAAPAAEGEPGAVKGPWGDWRAPRWAVIVPAGIWEYEHSGVGDLFVGVMPCGISYCDRTREEGGDFVRLAFLSYATLTLVWRTAPAALKPGLRWAVEDDAACLIARRGEAFFIDSRGCKSVILGDGG